MVSEDGGRQWVEHPAPSAQEWKAPTEMSANDTPRWVEPLAWDATGTLYSAWADINRVQVAWSTDRATTWRTMTVAQARGFYPYLVAGRGELALTWFSGSISPNGKELVSLEGHAARIAVAGGNEPRILGIAALPLSAWTPGANPSDPPEQDPAGEYIATAFLSDGSLVAVMPIQDPVKKRFGFTFWRIGDTAVR
jgi:hypothetical protein